MGIVGTKKTTSRREGPWEGGMFEVQGKETEPLKKDQEMV